MIISLLIFSILIFISPFIIFKLFKLNNYQGYLFGLLSFLAVLGLGVCLGFVAGIIMVILSIFMNAQSTTFTVLILIIYILILLGIYISIYLFHLEFIKKIKDENNNAVIFMYLSGYFLVTTIIAFFTSLDVDLFKNLGLPQNIYKSLNSIMQYLPYFNFSLTFGICICIFFYLKQNKKILFYLSIGIYSGELIISIIANIFNSMIMVVILTAIAILFPLFSLIIGIYLYIKYRQVDNLESIKELGNTTDGNLV